MQYINNPRIYNRAAIGISSILALWTNISEPKLQRSFSELPVHWCEPHILMRAIKLWHYPNLQCLYPIKLWHYPNLILNTNKPIQIPRHRPILYTDLWRRSRRFTDQCDKCRCIQIMALPKFAIKLVTNIITCNLLTYFGPLY